MFDKLPVGYNKILNIIFNDKHAVQSAIRGIYNTSDIGSINISVDKSECTQKADPFLSCFELFKWNNL